MIRVVVLSFWHVHAKDYTAEAINHPDVELAGIWDNDVARGQAAAQQYNVPFIASLDSIWADKTIDGVIVTTPTAMHRDIMLAASQAGKHIFTEKVIAATLREAEQIVAATQRAGIAFIVNMFRRYHASTLAIKEIIDSGALGHVTLLRVRDSHNGALRTPEAPNGWLVERFFDPIEAQGGVLTDLCHPVYLTRFLLGRPTSVNASYGWHTQRAVEDNAALSYRYDNGAIGIAETSFTTRYAPFTIEAHGTEGSLMYNQSSGNDLGEERKLTDAGIAVDPAQRLFGLHRKIRVRSTRLDGATQGWMVKEIPMGIDPPSAFSQWVGHVHQGTRDSDNTALALDLSAIVEAANLSAVQDRGIRLDQLQRG
jgi:1,5-anhydro-D-fructose reductase (1,5-anhydro-D-mannitol-forming)